jgi:protein gp37
MTEYRAGRLDWTGRLNLLHDRLLEPLSWPKPQKVFVNSQSDLFHKDVPDWFIAEAFAVMALARRHTFQVLTKRHARMRSLLAGARNNGFWDLMVKALFARGISGGFVWPLPNLWLGVSVEDQRWADIRIPALRATPAAVRWVSCEPLLGPIDLARHIRYEAEPGEGVLVRPTLSWVVTGGETGPGARPAHPDWFRHLRDQCQAAGIAFFHKQNGEWAPIGPLYSQTGHDQDAEDARLEAAMETRKVIQLERSGHVVEGHQPADPRTWLMVRAGKKAAGRELDGRIWDEYPEVSGVV